MDSDLPFHDLGYLGCPPWFYSHLELHGPSAISVYKLSDVSQMFALFDAPGNMRKTYAKEEEEGHGGELSFCHEACYRRKKEEV